MGVIKNFAVSVLVLAPNVPLATMFCSHVFVPKVAVPVRLVVDALVLSTVLLYFISMLDADEATAATATEPAATFIGSSHGIKRGSDGGRLSRTAY